MSGTGWEGVREAVRQRLHARDWPPGATIPREADLAREFGCARATVNRALRALAEEGLLERRRRAGTRVARRPVARATVRIPVIRQQIEETGAAYGYRLVSRGVGAAEGCEWRLGGASVLEVVALHLADGAPFVVEARRIDLATVPGAQAAPLDRVSANEWLLETVAYSHGRIAFDAVAAGSAEAALLGCEEAAPLIRVRRVTWDGARPVTSVDLVHAPGHAVRAEI